MFDTASLINRTADERTSLIELVESLSENQSSDSVVRKM